MVTRPPRLPRPQDLAYNNLTGSIPRSLTQLASIRQLDLSGNERLGLSTGASIDLSKVGIAMAATVLPLAALVAAVAAATVHYHRSVLKPVVRAKEIAAKEAATLSSSSRRPRVVRSARALLVSSARSPRALDNRVEEWSRKSPATTAASKRGLTKHASLSSLLQPRSASAASPQESGNSPLAPRGVGVAPRSALTFSGGASAARGPVVQHPAERSKPATGLVSTEQLASSPPVPQIPAPDTAAKAPPGELAPQPPSPPAADPPTPPPQPPRLHEAQSAPALAPASLVLASPVSPVVVAPEAAPVVSHRLASDDDAIAIAVAARPPYGGILKGFRSPHSGPRMPQWDLEGCATVPEEDARVPAFSSSLSAAGSSGIGTWFRTEPANAAAAAGAPTSLPSRAVSLVRASTDTHARASTKEAAPWGFASPLFGNIVRWMAGPVIGRGPSAAAAAAKPPAAVKETMDGGGEEVVGEKAAGAAGEAAVGGGKEDANNKRCALSDHALFRLGSY